MNFYTRLKELNAIIDERLNKLFIDKNFYQKNIFDSIEYSLFTGGKRLRPVMTLESFKLFSEDLERVIPYALAIEMIHTYSLVHDDLPSMDNDDFRRGKPTNHKVFGEAMAILAGDGLLNLAFETIANAMEQSNTIEDYKKHAKAFKEISRASGIYGMIGGQVVDLFTSHEDVNEDKLMFMYKRKTSDLIQVALVIGAIMGGASDEEIEIIRDFGINLGLAYQIRDDILDMDQDENINKITYLSFNNEEMAKNAVEEYSSNAILALKKLNGKNIEFLLNLTEELIKRDK